MGWDSSERSPASGVGGGAMSEPSWEHSLERPPVYAVVTAVADRTGQEPTELPPLADAVDPDALNALFAAGDGGTVRRVAFEYCGYTVVVRGDGAVELREADPES